MYKSLKSEPCSLPSTAFIHFLIFSKNTCRHRGLYLSSLRCRSFPRFTSPTCSHPTLLSCRDDLHVIPHSSIHCSLNHCFKIPCQCYCHWRCSACSRGPAADFREGLCADRQSPSSRRHRYHKFPHCMFNKR
ncbi:hypothetical protein BGY98DRAFT_143279 [Russula aff. rugulosa BPL654]|nr:hypothetical protein BGY98DRAFT_143279 [Russula aff. rugulosa BPL654]